jgi:Ca2+-binding RTX toxin-like protein
MTAIFNVQGFGFQSDWNGQLVTNDAHEALNRIASTHANSISIVPRIFTEQASSNQVFSHPDKTESNENLAAAVADAHALGLSVLFKPALTPLDGSGQMSLAPTDVDQFFASYQAMIVAFAEVAQATGVDSFSIGNEMSSLSGAPYRDYWIGIINAVREVYSGTITYAAATDEANHVSFWDAVDEIGVNAYPPLTANTAPTVDEMVAAWRSVSANDYWAAAMDHMSPVDFFHSLAMEYDKPVLFTEVGYRSMDGTNIRPGGWNVDGPQDVGEQRDAFDALFQVWSSEGSWFNGFHIWNWDPTNAYSPTGYSPMDKPAEALITDWFAGEIGTPPRTVAGSPDADLIDVGRGDDNLSGGLGDDMIRGGAGNDTIVGGPDSIPRLESSTVTVTGFGSVLDGIGARMQLLVNDQPVGDVIEFRSAAGPSDYQTFDITFENPSEISSLRLAFINDESNKGGDRNLYIKDIVVNGQHLSATDSVNTSSPGTWNLYHNASIDYDMSQRQSLFFGASSDNDVIDAGPGNDLIRGGAGNDRIGGGIGNDTVYGGIGDDWIDGGTGSDKLYGDDGNDVVIGGEGNDYLFGLNGDDILNGGPGNDYLHGGNGSDTFVFEPGFGADIIGQFHDGAGTEDTIQFDRTIFADFAEVQERMVQVGTSVFIMAENGDSVELQRVTLAQMGADDFLFV